MRKCRNWQTSKTKDLVTVYVVWVQVPSSALDTKKPQALSLRLFSYTHWGESLSPSGFP